MQTTHRLNTSKQYDSLEKYHHLQHRTGKHKACDLLKTKKKKSNTSTNNNNYYF